MTIAEEGCLKISANDFWRLLPIALERLDDHLRLQLGVPLEIRVFHFPVRGRRNPSPGEEMRGVIRSDHQRHYPVNPLTAVLWYLSGDYVQSRVRRTARVLGMDARFYRRVDDAIHHRPGFSRPVRRKLLEACKLDQKHLEPTTA
jgi:hypothetical protein